jgi:glycosyltransferase involved in cell wall biosynthesis
MEQIMMHEQPFLTVIVPLYNANRFIGRCLDALLASSYQSYEIIVVDDCSTDNSAEVCREKGMTVLTMERQSGPAAARNFGAQKAQGEILFFVDSDVVVRPDTLARAAEDFMKSPTIAAVFGSYDDDPAEKNFLSQYKNLQHHFVHQQSDEAAGTFWAGCGAIRREVFEALEGFDSESYPKPSIEDIELGYRIRRNGHGILLDKKLQVKHLKQWTLWSWLRADIFYRAVPWSNLILESKGLVNDLNLQTSDRLSAGLVGLSTALLPVSLFRPEWFGAILLLLAIVVVLNSKFYGFFRKRKGLGFAILVFPSHLLYYFYSGLTFMICWSKHFLFGKQLKLKGISR